MTRRKKIITVVLVVLLAGLGWLGYDIWDYAYVEVPDAYAVWHAASHINDYMDAHDGAWPRGWDDLRKTYESTHPVNPKYWADLEARVDVDWNADPRLLAASPEPHGDNLPFNVIWLKSGSRAHWSVAEPNWLIWEYLQERAHPKAQTQPTNTQPSDGSK